MLRAFAASLRLQTRRRQSRWLATYPPGSLIDDPTEFDDPEFDEPLEAEASTSTPPEYDELDRPPAAPQGSRPAVRQPVMGAAVLERIGNTAKNRDPTNDHRLCVFSSRNNTILTFTRPSGTVISWTSGGRAGFKKVQRSSYEAGYACALKIFEEVKRVRNEEKIEGLHVLFKGFGQGREAVFRALLTSDGALVKELVTRLTDTTPIKIGGTRAKKARRL